MLKKNKKLILLIFMLLLFFNVNSYGKIKINVIVNNEIITNIDIIKEAEYLKILNPNLVQLNENKILELSKTSLINQVVKKKEILKYIDMNIIENKFSNEYLKNLYLRLNYNNEEDFKKDLNSRNTYSIDEIKSKINIELYWNEIIYEKYNKLIKIDKKLFINKIDNMKNEEQKEYFLSEIVFTKKKNIKLDDQLNQIKLSINDIGFKNTANIYSVSQSSKFGGDLGWVSENSLSKKISEKLSKLKKGETTNAINIGNTYLILKVDEIKINKITIDKEKELEKLIQAETNKQLNKYSRIYFDKSKINYSISEK
jgi:peptidyl-prolyl cis-trans isomerase SurA